MSKRLETLTEEQANRLVANAKAEFHSFGFDSKAILKLKDKGSVYHKSDNSNEYVCVGVMNTQLNKGEGR